MSGERNWKREILRVLSDATEGHPTRAVDLARVAERLGVETDEIRGAWNRLKAEKLIRPKGAGQGLDGPCNITVSGGEYLRQVEMQSPPSQTFHVENLQTGDGSSVIVGGTQTNSRSDVQINLNLDLIVRAFEQAIVESDLNFAQKEEARGLLTRVLKHPLFVGIATRAISLLAKWIGPS